MDVKNILQNHFTIKVADLIIEIDTISPRTCILCRDYLFDGEPDITVKVTPEDVENERRNCENPEKKEIFIETVAAYRKIVESALPFSIFLMHGAVIAKDNHSFMFTAPSGTGKTTHIKQWLRNAKDSYVVNGDKPLIKISDGKVFACGTPWSGNEHLNSNAIVPLQSIVLMERSEENYIEEISFKEAFLFLLQQTYMPSDAMKAQKTLNLLSQLSEKVHFYRFRCNNFKDDCFDVAYNALIGEKA